MEYFPIRKYCRTDNNDNNYSDNINTNYNNNNNMLWIIELAFVVPDLFQGCF